MSCQEAKIAQLLVKVRDPIASVSLQVISVASDENNEDRSEWMM